jgi:hypothetical protein
MAATRIKGAAISFFFNHQGHEGEPAGKGSGSGSLNKSISGHTNILNCDPFFKACLSSLPCGHFRNGRTKTSISHFAPCRRRPGSPFHQIDTDAVGFPQLITSSSFRKHITFDMPK